MSHVNEKTRSAVTRLVAVVMVAVALLLTGTANAAVPGITASAGGSSTFNLVANQGYISQPDGAQIYSWGYGCATSSATFVPYTTAAFCPTMQVPGPTMIVTQGTPFTVTLTNNLPKGAGNTSIVFQGATVTVVGSPSGGTGLLAAEAAPAGSVTYSVTYANAGTHAFYSGTQSDLQIEMGMYGAVVVLPSATPSGANCSGIGSDIGQQLGGGKGDFRLAVAAYNHPEACYDREYLTQWMELDAHIHKQAENQVQAIANCVPPANGNNPCPTALDVKTEPYHPSYFMINGRSMPDNMDPSYAPNYPNQPYNANPHMHPGDMVLIRVVGQGHWQHPFHEHGNHVRILARDGNLIVSQNDTVSPPRLAGRMEFNTVRDQYRCLKDPDGGFGCCGNQDAIGCRSGARGRYYRRGAQMEVRPVCRPRSSTGSQGSRLARTTPNAQGCVGRFLGSITARRPILPLQGDVARGMGIVRCFSPGRP